MSAVVIDTNVLLVADGQAKQMSPQCRAACVTRLEQVQSREQVVLDHSRLILGEYHHKLNPNRQPSPGRAFLKWLLQRMAMSQHVCYVTITATDKEQTIFAE